MFLFCSDAGRSGAEDVGEHEMNTYPAWQGSTLREHLLFRPLPLDVAEKMHIDDLRADFWAACSRLHAGIGASRLPADLPLVKMDEVSMLERDYILDTLSRYAFWFDPTGGHLPPSPQEPVVPVATA